MTPAEARVLLRAGLDLWFPRTDLVGGYVSARARARHEAAEDAAEAEWNARCAERRRIADLPDGDLQWLLDQGWRP